MEMYGETCPSTSAEVRGWFKDKNLEDMGRKYWKKRPMYSKALLQIMH